jgi:hypothetical protein
VSCYHGPGAQMEGGYSVDNAVAVLQVVPGSARA